MKKDNDVYIAVPAVLGGMMVGVTVLFLLFASSLMDLLIPIMWAFVVLGIAALFFAYKSKK
jgi:hypothetical protein